MPIDALASWHELIRSRNLSDLDHLLAEKVVFYSPVVYKPKAGKILNVLQIRALAQRFGVSPAVFF